jgi:MOSC domain-containing protein YiiM
MAGRVEAIYITDTEGVVPEPVERVAAHAAKGLEGNRYFYADGAAPPGRALTLIAAEALEAYEAETGKRLAAAESRRNVLVRGIDVNALVGKRFRVGVVECEGVELCEPCSHLESMTHHGVIKGMVHRAGLNADVLTDGEIAVGDDVAEI